MPEKTVLIIEDDHSFAGFLEVATTAAGHRAQVARDGAEAIDLFTILEPDLVLLDLLLPKKDGFAVCSEIRAHPQNGRTPVVMITGVYRKRDYLEQAQRTLGVDEFLTKPVRIVDLWRVFDRYLGPQGERGDAEKESPALGASDTNFLGDPLDEVPFARVLGEVHRERKTGLLFLKSPAFTQIFFVREGKIVFVRSNEPGARLGDLLVKSGRLTPEALEPAQKLYDAGRGRSRLGEILIGLGLLTPDSLRDILREQLRALSLRAFEVDEGRTTFVEGPIPEDEEIAVPIEIPGLILEGVQRMPASSPIRAHMPAPDTVLAPATNPPGGLDLTPTDRQVLGLADGTKPVSRIIAIGRLAQVDAERLVFGFLHAGLLEIASEAPPRRPDPRSKTGKEGAPLVFERAGDLRRIEIGSLLARLYYARKTGTLACERPGRKVWLHVHRGEIVFVRSDDRESRLGEILVDGGLVTQAKIDAAVEEASSATEGERIGQVLVQQGLISLEELHWAVRIQMQRRIQELFAWEEGSFRFREGEPAGEEAILLELGTLDVVLEGIRKLPSERLEAVFPRTKTPYRKSWNCHEVAAALRLSAEERDILAKLPDRGTADALLTAAGGAGEPARRALYGLLTVGLLEAEKQDANVLDEIRFEMEEDEDTVPPALATPEPPRPVPPVAPAAEAPSPGPAVPRFLFEQVLEERNQLETSLLEMRRSLGEVRSELLNARDELMTLRRSSLLRDLGTDPAEMFGMALEHLERRIDGAVRQTPEPPADPVLAPAGTPAPGAPEPEPDAPGAVN